MNKVRADLTDVLQVFDVVSLCAHDLVDDVAPHLLLAGQPGAALVLAGRRLLQPRQEVLHGLVLVHAQLREQGSKVSQSAGRRPIRADRRSDGARRRLTRTKLAGNQPSLSRMRPHHHSLLEASTTSMTSPALKPSSWSSMVTWSHSASANTTLPSLISCNHHNQSAEVKGQSCDLTHASGNETRRNMFGGNETRRNMFVNDVFFFMTKTRRRRN